jgi:hypothetical protein
MTMYILTRLADEDLLELVAFLKISHQYYLGTMAWNPEHRWVRYGMIPRAPQYDGMEPRTPSGALVRSWVPARISCLPRQKANSR